MSEDSYGTVMLTYLISSIVDIGPALLQNNYTKLFQMSIATRSSFLGVEDLL